MKTNVAQTSLDAYHSTAAKELNRREQEIMALFADANRIMSRKQIFKALQAKLGDSAPGEGGVRGRVNALIAAKRLAHRGEVVDQKTKKPQELVGLPFYGQPELFA